MDEAERTPLSTATEQELARIWARVLNVPEERIGADADFFVLGGDTLLAVQLVSRVAERLGVDIPVRSLFEFADLRSLAASIDEARDSATFSQPIQASGRERTAPASFAQQRLWFLDQLGDGGDVTDPVALRLTGKLNIRALRDAFNTLIRRHESLRTTFRMAGDERGLEQVIADDLSVDIPVVAVTSEAELAACLSDRARHVFDLSKGPLFDIRLIRTGELNHILLINLHHIVTDDWSNGVLVRELIELYGAYSRDLPNPLQPLPVQYADYARWQRQGLQEQRLKQQGQYWQRALKGAPQLLKLPSDRPRPATQSDAAAQIPIVLEPELADGLKSLSQRHGTTLLMTVMTAWAALLSRLSGQDEVVIGTPTDNRSRPEIEGLIGLFVNTLAIRIDASGSPATGELLERVKQQMLSAQANRDMPFEQVVKRLNPERTFAHSPIFQVMLAWQNLPSVDGGGRSDLSFEHHVVPRVATQFDLSLSFREVDGRILGEVVYATSLFEPATIQRYVSYWKCLLQGMVADERQPLDQLPILSQSEYEQIVVQWNRTQAEYPHDRCIHELFEEQARKSPDATAVVSEQRSLSYAELNQQANRLAHHLRERGVQTGEHVIVRLPRSPELIISELAVLKCGAAYVPIDQEWPHERQVFVAQDCQAKWLLGDSAHSESGLPDVQLISVAQVLADDVDTPTKPISSAGSESSAYVMYTSGSTGTPKGVVVPHRAISRLVLNTHYVQIEVSDRVSFGATPAFDASTFEVWAPLLNGARVIVIDADTVRDPHLLVATLRKQAVSVLWLTTGLLTQHLDVLGESLSSLRYVLFGGEVVDPRVVARIFQMGAPKCLVHCYGPTETTTFASTCPLTAVLDETRGISIGRPIANTQIYILDKHRRPVPIGVEGEIYIGGAGVARGYLNRPELTAERFVVDPFSGEREARLYRTGDVGRFRADGNIEFVGRNDHQVKIRGYRIELGEIEARLLQQAEVKEAAVLAREDMPGEKRLVAYYSADTVIDVGSLRTRLQQQLPAYMVPAAFVHLPALPLTSNGKVDRKALPAPEGDAYTHRTYEAPQGEMEIALAGIWQELLQIQQVGRHDHFFELGGHSLLAVRLVSRVRQALGIELTVRDVFEHPVLSAQAQAMRPAGASEMLPITPTRRDAPIPLSFAQQRLWFLAQLKSQAGRAYHIPFGLRLVGPLDRAALRAALDRMVQRHESLRTRFVQVDGTALQQIDDARIGFALRERDLEQLNESDRASQLQQLAEQEADAAFDLAAGPLIRGQLLRMSDQQHVLLITMHHIISDGWSMGVFSNELVALYGAYAQGQPDPLPALSVQYADYARWERQHLQGSVLSNRLGYWKSKLAGIPQLLNFPADKPRPSSKTYQGATQSFRFPEPLLGQLRSLALREHVTLFMVLMAAFKTLLWRYSGQEDVVIGTPIANRNRPELDGLIGFFVNTLVMRDKLAGEKSFVELLREVKRTSLEAFEQGEVPFENLVEALNPPRSHSHTPLFQFMFVLQNAPAWKFDLPGLQVSWLELANSTSQFDMTLSVSEEQGGLTGFVEYSTDLFVAETISSLIERFELLLRGIVAHPEQKLSQFTLLSAPEQQRIVVEWNRTDAEYPTDICIHSLFEAQAAKSPDAIAVLYDGQQLTYRELNARANQLAHYLIDAGVRPDTFVALCVERSLDMLPAILGILKAGGAYVPLDPSYPRARLSYMLEDCGARFVVTQKSLLPLVALGNRKTVCLDDPRTRVELAEGDRRDPQPEALGLTSRHLAYAIYTSGSTGQPKASVIEHRSVCNLIAWYLKEYAFTSADRTLIVSAISFDLTQKNIWAPLCTGGTAVVPAFERFDPVIVMRTIADTGVTTINCTPSLFYTLIENRRNWPSLASLRLVLLGGEPIERPRVDPWLQDPGCHATLINMYGPTECTDISNAYRYDPAAPPSSRVPIGKPISNVKLYVLGPDRAVQPVGIPGELYIGGAGLGRGYFGRADLTRERFVPDPFSEGATERLYRTGDLVRWLPDGNIEFLGRVDSQVKLRGYRIELGEIEAQIAQLKGVKEAVASIREQPGREARLIAYVVKDAGATNGTSSPLSADEYKARWTDTLNQVLPAYMVPETFVFLDALPLTPSGKVDRNALPEPQEQLTTSYVPPKTDLEMQLCRLWESVLQLTRVGVEDNFFALGGHSLLAVRLVNRLQESLGKLVHVALIFDAPTVRELARHLERHYADASPRLHHLPPMQRADRSRELVLSHAQQRLWFIDRLERGSPQYNLPAVIRLAGVLDIGALKAAFDAILRRHEVLRTRIATLKDRPHQVVAQTYELPVLELDLSGLPPEQRAARLLSIAQEDAARAFDLTADLPLRVQILKLSDREHVVLLNMHHIASDGWSLGILLEDLSKLYEANVLGRPDPLPPLVLQYADYARWHREWLQGGVLDEQLRYWKQQLAGIPQVHRVPLDKPRPARQRFKGKLHQSVIAPELSACIARFCRQHDATLFMFMQAAFAVLMGRYSGETDIVIGSPIAGRTHKDAEGLIGFFANTLVLRNDLTAAPTFNAFFERAKRTILDAYTHQHVPFEVLVEEVNPERNLSHSPLFQLLLAVQNDTGQQLRLPGLELEWLTFADSVIKFDIELYVTERNQRLSLDWVYDDNLFHAATIARMSENFLVLIESILAAPELSINAFEMVSQAEQQILLQEWNARDVPHPRHECIHTVFEAQAARYPDHIAIVRDGVSLSYRELNEKANRLAHFLIGQGVRPDTPVGLCLRRVPNLLVGILGVLKAGGAYVPLDPAYPADRLAYMLKDCRPKVVLAQKDSLQVLPEGEQQVVCLDDDSVIATLQRCPTDNIDPDALQLTSRNLAYLIYTSGSTGWPKGICIEHASVRSLVAWLEREFSPESRSRVLCSTSMCFDLFVFEIWAAWSCGASVLLVEDVLELAERPNIQPTLVNTVPSALNALLDLGHRLEHTHTVNLAGEPLSGKLVNRVFELTPVTVVNNLYGPSEDTTYSTHAKFLGPVDVAPSIGTGIDNTRVYVLNELEVLQPIGVAGELYIGGAGLARGYLNQPELTQQKFVADPFGHAPDDRLYRTGDRVRWLPDGNLHFMGRMDHQVKLRGFRIELGEIESQLRRVPGVKDCVALVRRDEGRPEQLVAYIVPDDDAAQGVNAWGRSSQEREQFYTAALRRSLPNYMLPGVYVFLRQLPLTPNGKTDRKALPPPDSGDLPVDTYVAPRDEIEARLCQIWLEVLAGPRSQSHVLQ